ncbi:hypothetical protein [Fortiea contorta]|uniref:hypothetical protein n=1 Tax=Fortiea contorta TaxID=1892405 RepID=UPI00034781AB|nr:hypothetical protein [Fortiea contorta]
MKFKAIAVSIVSAFLFSLLLTSLNSQAQNRPQPTRNNSNTNTATPNDWSKIPRTEAEFMQGCMGQQSLQPAQRNAKQNFCQCAFSAYKSRYNPQTFSQINALAVKVGQDGPRLVNLMMKPELDRCSNQNNYHP